jgi:hypothetical protein
MITISSIKRAVSSGLVAFASVVFVLSPATVLAVGPVAVYDNITSPQPANVPSLGYEATSTSEFGGQLGLAGSERTNPNVTVLMSSWACQTGNWYGGCVTTPGSTFMHPVTLNVYNVNADNSVGSVIATKTTTFTMPFRPSSDNCGGDSTAWTAADSSCNHGLAFPITFNLSGVTLPNKVIVGVAYNTAHYGAQPLGVTGPYDSLNVGLVGNPTVGTALPTANDAYLNSSWSGAYCDGNLGTGTFRLDAGCWGGYLPAFKVTASSAPVTLANKDQCKNDGWKTSTSPAFKNQGDCVSSFASKNK